MLSYLTKDNNPIVVNLTYLGLIAVKGMGAKSLLQGQMTCNLEDITLNKTSLGAQCNPQGRIISFFRIIQVEEGYLLQMPKTLIPYTLQALKKYAVFYKNLTLLDCSDFYNQVGYIGSSLPVLEAEAHPQHLEEAISHEGMIIINVGQVLGRNRYELMIPLATTSSPLLGYLTDPKPESLWQSINISEELPTIYPETTEQFLPHELNLPALHAVSFNKGCYTGQEIIARMEYRGKLKKCLKHIRATIDISPERGQDVFCHGKRCGNIVDFCQISYNQTTYDILIVLDNNELSEALSLDSEQNYKLTPLAGV